MPKTEAQKRANRNYRRRQKLNKYNNIVYCIDIETSTAHGTNCDGESVPCAYMISYAISTLDTTTGDIMHYNFGRTYENLQSDLEGIQKQSDSRPTLIYCHNFAYEWSFFKDNVHFFKDNVTSQLFMSRHKPLMIDCKNLSFRCSYLLFGKSVKTMGAELSAITGESWEKLEFEYNKIRTPLTEITPEEMAYNYKDCDIVLKYLYEKMIVTYGIDNLYDSLYTKTGIVRFDNKKYNTSNDYQRFLFFNKDCVPATEKQYAIEQLCFMGGLVSCYPAVIGRREPLHNIASYDIASSYPYQMLKLYPTHFTERADLQNLALFEQFRNSQRYNKHDFFYGIIAIKNLKLNRLLYPILSNHKFFESVDCEQIFGKVLEATSGVLVCTSLDFENYKRFYDFEVVEIRSIYTNKYTHYLPPFTIKSIARLLKAKTALKQYNNEVQHANKLHNDYVFSDDFKYLEKIINEIDNYQIQKAVIAQEYTRIKGNLNAMYGINVEAPIKPTITYNFDTLEYEKEAGDFEKFKNKKFVKTNMLVGVFITAYARQQLVDLLYKLLINGIQVYYTDTDSLKVDYTQADKVEAIISDYNKHIEQNPYNIGVFEFEDNYSNFVINGNKSYISEKNGVISATIAGLPNASIIYQSLLDYYNGDFKKMITNCFSFNVEINPNVTDKLTSKYPVSPVDVEDLDYSTQLIHMDIDGYNDYVYTGLILDDCPVTIKGIDTSLSNMRSAINLHKYYKLDLNNCIDKRQIIRDNEGSIIVKNNGKITERIRKEFKKWQNGKE